MRFWDSETIFHNLVAEIVKPIISRYRDKHLPSFLESGLILVSSSLGDHKISAEISPYGAFGNIVKDEIVDQLNTQFASLEKMPLKLRNASHQENIFENMPFASRAALEALLLKQIMLTTGNASFAAIAKALPKYASGGMSFEGQGHAQIFSDLEWISKRRSEFIGYKFRPPVPRGLDHFQRTLCPPEVDLTWVEVAIKIIRERFQTPDFFVFCDFGQRLPASDDIFERLAIFRRMGLSIVEEPFLRSELESYASLNEKEPGFVAGGEYLSGINHMEQALDSNGFAFLQPDMNLMPFTELMKSLSHLENESVKLIPHNWTSIANYETNALVGSLCGCKMIEYPIFDGALTV